MGRYAYQPLLEENSDISKPGQLIMDYYTGHISVNKNNIIISITKEIESKLIDFIELMHEVDEQYDVILNLLEDYLKFIQTDLKELEDLRNIIIALDAKMLYFSSYLVDFNSGMNDKINRIKEILQEMRDVNSRHVTEISVIKNRLDVLLPLLDIENYVRQEYQSLIALKNSFT